LTRLLLIVTIRIEMGSQVEPVSIEIYGWKHGGVMVSTCYW